ncbi:MAG TPA: hypothetical protein VE077_16475 [Candidatus Methylomirabilis sp.]|nr:hypothetical protein [Candidatus Methylomirabilis sp.]
MPLTRALAVRILKYTLTSALIFVGVVYLIDYASVRIRMLHPKPDDPLETVTALRILAIDEKGNKTEYTLDPLQPQQTAVCVHSLFPHFGNEPCWYLKKKFAQPIPMAFLTMRKLIH